MSQDPFPESQLGTVWLTGLSGAGKTTLAVELCAIFESRGLRPHLLDGDELRRGLSSDLGMSHADRSEQARRAAHVALLLFSAGLVPVVALVSPYARDRDRARELHAGQGVPFSEVWVDTPLEICEGRDPKGLYERTRAGRLHGLTGLDSPYETPAAPDVQVRGYGEPAKVTAGRLADALLRQPRSA